MALIKHSYCIALILYEKKASEFLDEIWKFWLWLAAENWSIILSKGSACGSLAICDPSFGRARGEGSKVKWPASTYVGASPFPWALLNNDPKLRITFGYHFENPSHLLQFIFYFFINHVQVLQQVISAEIFELCKNAKNIMKTLYVHTFHWAVSWLKNGSFYFDRHLEENRKTLIFIKVCSKYPWSINCSETFEFQFPNGIINFRSQCL